MSSWVLGQGALLSSGPGGVAAAGLAARARPCASAVARVRSSSFDHCCGAGGCPNASAEEDSAIDRSGPDFFRAMRCQVSVQASNYRLLAVIVENFHAKLYLFLAKLGDSILSDSRKAYNSASHGLNRRWQGVQPCKTPPLCENLRARRSLRVAGSPASLCSRRGSKALAGRRRRRRATQQ